MNKRVFLPGFCHQYQKQNKFKNLKGPSSPFCAYFQLITKFVIVELTVRILFKCSQWELLICKFHLLN